MNSQIDHVLKRVGIHVLEDWGMMLLDEVDSSTGFFLEDKPLIVSSVNFRGPMNGNIRIVTQPGFMEALSRNVLGLDFEESVSQATQEDTLKELANILLGNFLTEAYGEDNVFALVQPELSKSQPGDVDSILPAKHSYYLRADGEPIALTFAVEV